LAALTEGRKVRRRVIKITGRSESQVEEVAHPIYSGLSTPSLPIQTTILASPGQIELHLSGAGTDIAATDAAIDEGVARLVAALGSAVFSADGRPLEAVVGHLLRDQGLRIAVAESCTGGLLLGRLTEVPGSSTWVTGGVVAYSNDVKVNQLGVSPSALASHGAVSEPVAQAMAEGVRRLGAEIGVAITGIAGPDGGSPEKPVGMVVIAVTGSQPAVRTFHFPGDRDAVRRFATSAALDMIRRSVM
jgi:nicotinamide-nucleotide amidase